MKCLSIYQPWAWLVVTGVKDVENRSWKCPHRGPLLIHASKRFDQDGYWRLQREFGLTLPDPNDFDYGGIVGAVRMVGCVPHCNSPWFEGPWGFVFRNAVVLPYQAMRGRQKLFDVVVDGQLNRALRRCGLALARV